MGYATIQRVPYLRDYEQALKLYEGVKPVRGRDPEIRPMGDRRDADTYHIRKNGDDVECVLYATPVVTFKPDGVVVIYTNGYDTASTNQFINQVVDFPAQHVRGVCVLTIGGKKYPLGDKHTLTLKANGDAQSGRFDVLDAEVLKGYVLNRAKANNVRERYKPFLTYVKTMTKIRREVTHNRYRNTDYHVVRITHAEFAEHFPLNANSISFDVSEYAQLTNKALNDYSQNNARFMELVQSSDVADFHKAFLCVVLTAEKCWGYFHVREEGMEARVDKLKATLDDIILMRHADEVLDVVELAVGKLPNRKYMGWV
jgi:hypothetical protein